MSASFGLSGRTVMVTGGASGIGRACAMALAREGAAVAVADANAEGAAAVVQEIEALGARAVAVSFDVRDPAATDSTIAAIERDLGPLDGLITAAGISRPAPATELLTESWEAVIGVNLSGTFYSCQAAGRRMVARGRGAIVTIGSVSSLGGQSGRAHYCASKAGVVGLTRDLAIEWGSHGVRVNCIGPSATDTPMIRAGIPESFVSGVMEDRTPLARLARPEEIANVCLFLLSDLASYVNGALIMADGGLSAGFFTRSHGRDFSSRALLAQGIYSESTDADMTKLALVTGAGRGIGAAIAHKLAIDGWRVAVCDLTKEPAAAVATSLPGEGHSAWAVDVSDESSVETLFQAIEAAHGPVTALICNAGILLMAADGERPTIFDMTLDDWERTHAVNTRGVFLSIRAYARRRRERPVEGGRITTTSSVAAELGGYRGSASYISSKSAILGFTKAMARELAPLGITVNCVAPGIIDAPMLAAATPRSAAPGSLDMLAQAVPLSRLGQPDDIAGAVAFLLSAQASYITGATLDVNGGYRMA